jgi:hypothetical protein
MRYEAAMARGCTQSEAVRASFPFDKHGYIDDSLCPTISLFIDLFFEELLKYCDDVGILLSIPKFHKADALGRLWIMDGQRVWAASTMGCLAPLGKFLVMTLKGGVIKEKPERLVQIIARTTAFLQGAMQHTSGLVKYEEFEAIIGVWLYIAQTCLALVPLLQYPLRNLHAKFRHDKTLVGGSIPLVDKAKREMELVMIMGKQNPGVAFAPDTAAIRWESVIWVVHDAAGAALDTAGLLIDDYRGHFTMILAPSTGQVHYVKGRWTAEQLLNNHSTTLEACGGNCGLAVVLQLFPKGDIIECFDSQSATMAMRRMGCRSLPLSAQVEQRGVLMASIGFGRRLFVLWFPRTINTIADAGSKDEMAEVERLLHERGFTLCPEPEMITHPVVFGPVRQEELLLTKGEYELLPPTRD